MDIESVWPFLADIRVLTLAVFQALEGDDRDVDWQIEIIAGSSECGSTVDKNRYN